MRYDIWLVPKWSTYDVVYDYRGDCKDKEIGLGEPMNRGNYLENETLLLFSGRLGSTPRGCGQRPHDKDLDEQDSHAQASSRKLRCVSKPDHDKHLPVITKSSISERTQLIRCPDITSKLYIPPS